MPKKTKPDNERFLDSLKKAYFLFSRRIDGDITSVSQSVKTMLGYESSKFSKILADIFKERPLLNRRTDGTSFTTKEQPNEYELSVNHENGQLRWLKITEIPVFNQEGEIKAFDCIAHDITNHRNLRNELQASENVLRASLGNSIRVLAATVETREYFSSGHHQRTSSISRLIAQELGFSALKTDTIRLAGIIHDIGKIAVPTEILNKRSALNDAEYGFVQNHPLIGYNILKEIDLPYPFAEMVLQHHERLDGSGYPNHLIGDEILPEARILAVADVIEAMASDRAHRPALKLDSIIDELYEQKGILFDPDVVDVSMRLLAEKIIVL